jgi:hypothetical protein
MRMIDIVCFVEIPCDIKPRPVVAVGDESRRNPATNGGGFMM